MPVKEKRNTTAEKLETEQKALEELSIGSTEPFKWAEKIAGLARELGLSCPYTSVEVFSEFSGSTCAEKAAESVVNNLATDIKIDFKYTADIKPICREVAMQTRGELRPFSLTTPMPD